MGALKQLQQLQLRNPYTWVLEESVLLQLAPKVTCSGVFAWSQEVVEALPNFAQLTQLAVGMGTGTHGVLQGTAEALVALTGLQQLVITCFMDDSLVPVLQQVAGMPTLRSLQLRGRVQVPSLGPSLAQCTQLTSLVIFYVAEPAMGACLGALQQLTRLQSLSMPAAVLEQQGGAAVVSLTALTRLCVHLGCMYKSHEAGASVAQAKVQRLLKHVRAWPAGLQQVVVVWSW
jgi:hypothetical protein